jgi:hypothetical protein
MSRIDAIDRDYIKKTSNSYPDIEIQREGTLFLAWPKTDKGAAWIGENVQEGATYWLQALVVEHRFIHPLIQGMIDDGLVVV